MTAALTTDQLASFERDGFLVLPDFVSSDACARLRQQANKLVDAFDPDEQRTVF
jgi:phytanoyl-CoA hydroxylase